MKQPLCDALFLYHAGTTAEDDDSLGPFYIVNCVIIPILSMTALIFNSVTIQVIRKTPALSQNLRTLLLSLGATFLFLAAFQEVTTQQRWQFVCRYMHRVCVSGKRFFHGVVFGCDHTEY